MTLATLRSVVRPRHRAGLAALLAGAMAVCPALASPAFAEPTTPVSGKAPATLPVGSCVNLGNHLDMARGGEIPHNKLTKADFVRMKAAGFDTVRLPVNWSSHSASTPPYTIDAAWLARVDEVVDAALGSGLKVILNSHNFDPVNDDPAAAAPWLAGVWQQLGDHYAKRPRDMLWFEIENEPNKALNNTNLVATFAPALAAIRKHNPDRPVIIGGENWSSIDSLATLTLPDDPQVWPTFHYYEPFDFTHQGAPWASPPPPLGRVYGSAADTARLPQDVAKIQAYIARTGKIPFMGETGAYESIPTAQRITYYRTVFQTFRPIGVPICVWGYVNTFPFYDAVLNRWVPGMLGAIGLPEPQPAP